MDIVSGTGDVLLGPNWHPAQSAGGDEFRWVTNDATAYVPAIERIEYRVTVELEAGHALDPAQPFALHVIDDEDRSIAEAVIIGRQTIQFQFPASRPTLHVMRFHVDHAPNSVAANNPGMPTFRVFSMLAEPLRPEVVPLLAGFRIGRGGWYGLEDLASDVFRWVNNDAEIVVTNPDAKTLELEVAPGPALGMRPLMLDVLERGEPFAHFVIDSRRRLSLELPDSGSVPYPITLHIQNGGAARPGYPRVLNFRLFHIPPA